MRATCSDKTKCTTHTNHFLDEVKKDSLKYYLAMYASEVISKRLIDFVNMKVNLEQLSEEFKDRLDYQYDWMPKLAEMDGCDAAYLLTKLFVGAAAAFLLDIQKSHQETPYAELEIFLERLFNEG